MFVGVRALLICRRQSPQSRSTPAAGNGWRAGLGRHFDASLTRAARVDASCWRWSVGDATNIAPSLRHYRKIWYRSPGETLRRRRISAVPEIGYCDPFRKIAEARCGISALALMLWENQYRKRVAQHQGHNGCGPSRCWQIRENPVFRNETRRRAGQYGKFGVSSVLTPRGMAALAK